MLKVIGLDDEEQWLGAVRAFENHDVYYLPQYTKAFHLHGDGEPLLFYYESPDTRGVNVAMKRDIAGAPQFSGVLPGGTYFDLATPYGYGGWLLEGDRSEAAVQKLGAAYGAYCRENNIVSEFVRFHPLLRNYDCLVPMYEIIEMGKTVYLDLSSPAVIDGNIQPRTHNRIRKAQRDGLSVGIGNSPEIFAQFTELYTVTMARNQAQPYYFFGHDFFDCVCREMPDNAMIFYTACGNEMAAMELVLYGNGRMHSHLQGSKRECQHLSPVPLLIYTEAMWGCDNGIREFHLGGGLGSTEDNIYQFKSNFNRFADTRFHTGRKIFDGEKYDWLLQLRSEVVAEPERPGFFPGYRA